MPYVRKIEVSPADADQLVRFVLWSWLWHTSGPVVKAAAKDLGRKRTATTEWMRNPTFDGKGRDELHRFEDARGIDNVSRLWRAIAAPFDQKYVLRADPQWWPNLRGQAHFRCAVDVLVAADAAIEDLRGTRPEALRAADGVALAQVATGLARVQAGPYGFMSEAYLRLVLLLPYAVEVVADFCLRSPVGFRVLRTFDRALRRPDTPPQVVQAAATLVGHFFQQPASLRSVNQLRLARRLAMRPDVGAVWAPRIAQRLAHFARDRSRDLLQRRCAAWYLAELSGRAPVDDWWDGTRRDIRPEAPMRDIAAVDVVALAEATRQCSPYHTVDFAALDWALPTTTTGEVLLEGVLGAPQRVRRGRDVPAALRQATMLLLRDALRTPCPIRWRTIVETLHAASPEVQTYVVARLREVADDAAAETRPDPVQHLRQRALLLLANLQATARSLKTVVTHAGDAATPPHVQATAVWGIGDLLLANPQLARDRAMTTLVRALAHPAPAVRQAAIHSVASTRESWLIASVEDAATRDRHDHETPRWAAWAIDLMRAESI